MKRLEIDEITDWFIKNHFPNTMASCMTDTVCLFIEMVEKLRDEKEWLIDLLYKQLVETPITIDQYRKMIIDMMQQALKEE